MNYKIYCHQNKLQIQSFSTTLSIFTFEINYRMETRNLKMPLVDWNWSYPPYFSSLFLLIFLLGLLVQQLVQVVEAGLVGAVDVVPPVADEVLLVENRAVGAEEGGIVPTRSAHVERLT